eukprot:234803-Amorphochlora_amoeboformis.AAC.2
MAGGVPSPIQGAKLALILASFLGAVATPSNIGLQPAVSGCRGVFLRPSVRVNRGPRARLSVFRARKSAHNEVAPKVEADDSKNTYFVTLGVGSYIDYDKALRINPSTRLAQNAYVKSKMVEGVIQAFGPFRGLIFPPTTPQEVAMWVISASSVEEVQDSPGERSIRAEKRNGAPGQLVRHMTCIFSVIVVLIEPITFRESIQEQIEEVRRDVEASRRVHQLLQNELDVAHSELKTARSEYDKYNREVNLQRFDWVNSGSLETFDRLKPVYDGFEELQASSKAKTDSEEEIEEMYQTLARDFINLYEQ